MTDYERTTTRETTTVDPAATPAYTDPAAAAAGPGRAVRTTERAYVAAGPSGATTAARVVTFLFGVLQAALILRIILLLLVANPGQRHRVADPQHHRPVRRAVPRHVLDRQGVGR